ncbi:hypothetical protein Rsub_03077 [Raphidocelis subcapitata]|uniref:Uncharacterized protein n=1 Tax=Raphidocelis subcapitata TaxID=307507 RepID=A0A2V0NT19_9CHLO|nr:hypothetical protein Rsub_03077 [Raphidocelis subcapitata]|eukprot:GBF90776.1 hypothetical protein Rsub_03077 [Raphidocelis subcapitata]
MRASGKGRRPAAAAPEPGRGLAAPRRALRLRAAACSTSSSSSSNNSSSLGSGGDSSSAAPPRPHAAARAPPALWRPRPRCVRAPASGGRLPNQADSLFSPTDREDMSIGLAERVATRSVSDLDYLSELLAIQQDDGPKHLGFFGTRNMGMTHQKLVEILSYAMVSTGNRIYTSGATGTNAAVIKGALRAEAGDLLTVILPQSRSKQPQESQELLEQVKNVVEMPHNDSLSLMDASRICNREIIGKVQQVICFAFHDSNLLLETCREAKDSKKIVTLFYLD